MLKFFPSLLLLILLLGLCACELGGKSASSALQEVATALEKNDASAFVAQFDLKACAANEIKNITEANEALSTLDQLGRRLGLGGMEDLLGNVFDVERELRQDFARKVSTGELALTCRKQQKPGCPWVPESLRRAEVEKISETAAVARVVTPEKLTTWLALVKEGESWRIVGWAVLKETAQAYAKGELAKTGKSQPKPKAEQKPLEL
ncbi:MAG: YfbM family protein [Desulfovibrio sp.]|nr:YfbM family protein [Desulfovibrio sp.]